RREEGHSYGTRYRQGAVQSHGRAGGVEGRSELRSARSRRNVGVIRREGARRPRGTRNSLRIAQACCLRAQRRRPRRRAQALRLRSAVSVIAEVTGAFGYFAPARSGLNAAAPAAAANKCFSICPARKPFVTCQMPWSAASASFANAYHAMTHHHGNGSSPWRVNNRSSSSAATPPNWSVTYRDRSPLMRQYTILITPSSNRMAR